MLFSQTFWYSVLLTAGCSVLSGCTSLPETTRTASVRDIQITEQLSSDSLIARPGDEVRWVNLRKDQSRVDIPNLKSDDLSCERGFSNWIGFLQESADLKPNETASLCFKNPGIIKYNVRAATALGGGMHILPGTVRID
jgi:hypothetical protein